MIEVPLYDYEVPSKTRQCRGVCSAIPKGMLCDDAFCRIFQFRNSRL